MSFFKEFDVILDAMLQDYLAQLPDADISQGSMIFIKSVATSSALWGIYKTAEHIKKQIFPDTADEANLDHHGAIRDVIKKTGESKSDYLSRVELRIKHPPAGGNKYDYQDWALQIQDIKACYVFPLAQGLGTVDIVPLADEVTTGSEIPNAAKIAEVTNFIENVRPVTGHTFRALTVNPISQDVTITGAGTAADLVQIQSDITAELNSMEPGQTLYRSRLVGIAIGGGALNPVVTVPAADVVPANNEDMIRPGTISINT